tara:strand:- start:245 stop:430 length:186 start_codon:yes stop_codon:yes gene_type:complete
MSETKKKADPRSLVFLGCTILGVGLGFCFFPEKLFVFIGCAIAGPGIGLLLAAYLPPRSRD